MSEALAKATKELVDAEESLLDSRTEESRQIRKLKKQTDQVKDSQKEFENSLRETVKSMSFADLGKQLKKDLLSPFEGFLNNLPAPIKTLGMIGMKAAQGVGNKFKKATDPGVRFDESMGGGGRWRKLHDDGKMGAMVSGADAEAMGATKEEHTAGKEQVGLLSSIKTGIFKLVAGFFALVAWFKKKFAKPDPSKETEKAIEASSGDGGEGGEGGDDGGGIFGGLGKTIKKIKGFIKKFMTWKGMLVLLIGSIIGGLAIKYWEPIKEIVLKIKDKIMGIYNTIKDWFMSIWNWGVAKGTDEDGEWSVTTFVTNIWKDIKEWFEGLWTWASEGIAAGWTNVTNFISGIWTTVKDWFTGLWAWGKDSGKNAAGDWKLSTFISGIFTGLKDWFFGLFGLKKDQTELDWETGEMKTIKGNWSFSGLIGKIFGGLKNWFFGLFGLSEDKQELDWETGEMKTIKGDWSLAGLATKVFGSIKEWFGKLFKFDSAGDVVASVVNVVTFLPNMIKDMIANISSWALKLFGFDEAAQKAANATEWSIGSMVVDAFIGIRDWFFGLFGLSKDKQEFDFDSGEMKTVKGDWSITGLIVKAVTSIKDFFWNENGTGLLNFDLSGVKEKMFDIGAVLGAVGKATKAAVKSIPKAFFGGEGPIEAFKRVMKESMPTSGSSVSKESDPFAADFSLPLANDAQIVAEKPTTMQAANALANGGPPGSGGGGTSVVDASTSNVATSSSSNTNVTVVNKAPARAYDPHTTAQYRRFRGMRGGGG
jgi:hypothetical protein